MWLLLSGQPRGREHAALFAFKAPIVRELSEAVLVPVRRQAPVERVDTIEAFLGMCVHETLEALYRLRLRGRVLSQEETLEEFEAVWAKGWSDTIRIVSEDLKARDYKRAG